MPILVDTSWLSRQEAAKRLDVSPLRIDQLGASGKLCFVATSLGKLYDPDAVETLRREREQRPVAVTQ
jgi:hypothetical protein